MEPTDLVISILKNRAKDLQVELEEVAAPVEYPFGVAVAEATIEQLHQLAGSMTLKEQEDFWDRIFNEFNGLLVQKQITEEVNNTLKK
jgi:hypothetical protein